MALSLTKARPEKWAYSGIMGVGDEMRLCAELGETQNQREATALNL
jgi:hypothetical protein